MQDTDIAWVAGLLEGEGCFSIYERKNRPNTTDCAIHCEMTDEDVIRKLHNIVGVGNISYRPARRNRQPTWILSVYKKHDIFKILISIMPYMSKRRLAKASEIFSIIEDKVI